MYLTNSLTRIYELLRFVTHRNVVSYLVCFRLVKFMNNFANFIS